MTKWVWVSGVRAPVGRDVVMALKRSGFKVLMIDSFHSMAAKSLCEKELIEFQLINSPFHNLSGFKSDIAALIRSYPPRSIIPTCEEVLWLGFIAKDMGISQALMAPEFTLLQRLHSKYFFSKELSYFDIATPKTHRFTSFAEGLDFQNQDLVFKPEFSRFGQNIFFGLEAFLASKPMISVARPFVAQTRIRGIESVMWAYCLKGKLAAICAYKPVLRQKNGASYGFVTIDHAPFQALIETYLNRSGALFSGHISFDIITDENNRHYVIECNPRAVSGLHFLRDHQDLGKVLCGDQIPDKPLCPPIGKMGVLKPTLYGFRLFDLALRRHETMIFNDLAEDFFVPMGTKSKILSMMAGLIDVVDFALKGLRSRRSAIWATTEDIAFNHPIMD
jgi:predicted ATP-grasp superfamily ATP-dependent carboligase